MYLRNITRENANKIKDILLNDGLNDEISLKFDSLNMEIKIINLAKSEYDEDNNAWIKFWGGFSEENTLCMKINNRYYDLAMFLGDWAYDYEIQQMHISLYSECRQFGDYFSQIDLSQAIEDENNIYIVKKISKLTGAGAIARLNKNLGNDKNAKMNRRYLLVDKLNAEVIPYCKEEWMCLNKIKKLDLNNPNMREDILYKFVYDFIKYAFTVEEIITEN